MYFPPVQPPIFNITVSSMDKENHTGIPATFSVGIPITFTAEVEFDPSVDMPLNVSGVWSKPNHLLDLEADSRVIIVEPYLFQESPKIYVSNLTVDVVRGDSGDYTFSLDVSSAAFTERISINSTRSINVLCKVAGLFAVFIATILRAAFSPQGVDVRSSGDAAAGNQFTLECLTRTATLSLSTLLEVKWLDQYNKTITSGPGYNISGMSNTTAANLTSTLTFPHLTTSQGGLYSCAVNMTIPGIVTDYQVINTLPVIVSSEFE